MTGESEGFEADYFGVLQKLINRITITDGDIYRRLK